MQNFPHITPCERRVAEGIGSLFPFALWINLASTMALTAAAGSLSRQSSTCSGHGSRSETPQSRLT
jgi:hypothetical protein